MATNLTSQEARKGEKVTITIEGGVSLGYLVDGVVWKTTGSVWACRADQCVHPMLSFERDGGKKYMDTAKRITGYS